MRLTRRGKAVLLMLAFGLALAVGFLTAPYNIDYSHGLPQVVDTRN